MERLSINDPPNATPPANPPQRFPPQGNLGQMTHGPPQLPPQMFTTAAQLLDLTDSACDLFDAALPRLTLSREASSGLARWEKVDRSIEDMGPVRYGNLDGSAVPQRRHTLTIDLVVHSEPCSPRHDRADDLDKEDDIPPNLVKAPFKEVFDLKKKEDNERKTNDKKRNNKLQGLGFEAEHSGEILF
ncbi:uncharacterized protein DSM5745_02226 [Aspergillus mulundensis]|uniref:Uncharacterized protein n=1 Tax=Aspergillus mulundensis TaxID=1810919 RepID=A0A3D8SWB4_9EURO|nr:hypothetical protein DSM5745_02226 [Aspergillus mulundensis]RDW90451.1 hypothetical protein DSM5745_02226 [Aspergillus mulundensis]